LGRISSLLRSSDFMVDVGFVVMTLAFFGVVLAVVKAVDKL
jgi:hypothetical protein